MTSATALLGLTAETSLHAGAGSSTGVIDLPIQREGHNGWPCVYGSAVKGALRDSYEQEFGKDDALCTLIFGPAPNAESGSEHAGALMISDARLLLLPVRSLTSQFKWVTCPSALDRLVRDMARLGLEAPRMPDFSQLTPSQAYMPNGGNTLYLEEYRFEPEPKPEELEFTDLIQTLAKLMKRNNADELLEHQLVIVHDDMFTHLATYATPVAAHIRIESASKTVQGGALWYEETLPPETLLYICLHANKARKENAEQDGSAILDGIKTGLFKERPYLQLGGNETVGMGWCAIKFYPEEPRHA